VSQEDRRPDEGDVHMFFSSCRMLIHGREPPKERFIEVDLLQSEVLLQHMLELSGYRMWLQDTLTKTLESTEDEVLEQPCAVKIQISLGVVYSIPVPVKRHDGHPVAVVQNVTCVNFRNSRDDEKNH